MSGTIHSAMMVKAHQITSSLTMEPSSGWSRWRRRCACSRRCPSCNVSTNTKRVGVESESSQHTEAIASVRASNRIMYARTVLCGLGVPCEGPTILLTDNKANMLVGNDAGSSVRSRHYLRMYRLLQQRIGSRDIALKFVPDAENPSDVLTKWVDSNKFERCVKYLAGERPTPM